MPKCNCFFSTRIKKINVVYFTGHVSLVYLISNDSKVFNANRSSSFIAGVYFIPLSLPYQGNPSAAMLYVQCNLPPKRQKCYLTQVFFPPVQTHAKRKRQINFSPNYVRVAFTLFSVSRTRQKKSFKARLVRRTWRIVHLDYGTH